MVNEFYITLEGEMAGHRSIERSMMISIPFIWEDTRTNISKHRLV